MPNMDRGSRRGSGCLRAAFLAAIASLPAVGCESPVDPSLELLLSQPEVEFRAVRGSTAPIQTSLTAWNGGGGRLGPVACPAEPASWLSCAVSSGNVIVLTADPSGLSGSPDPVNVLLDAPGGSGVVPVRLVIEVPALSLGASTVTFTAAEDAGVTTPPASVVALVNSGAGTLADLGEITCTPSDPRVGCSIDVPGGTVTLSIDPEGLGPGTHLYPVTVEAPQAEVSASLSVVLSVQPLPHIVLSTRDVHFEAIRGVDAPLARTVQVSNAGVGDLGALSCPAAPAPWLACAVVGSTVTLTALPGELTATPPAVQVPVTATGAANSPQSIGVSLSLGQPVLSLSNYWASFEAVAGDASTVPPERVIAVLNEGAGTPEHLGQVACAVPAGGPVSCLYDDAAGTLVLSVDAEDLEPGTTVYPVTVSAEHSGVSRTVTVVVTTRPSPFPVLDPDDLTFTFPPGATEPSTLTVAVTNGGGGSLGEVTCPSAPASWLTCAVVGDEGEELLQLTASPAGLAEAPDPIVLAVTAEHAPGAPAELTVRLTFE